VRSRRPRQNNSRALQADDRSRAAHPNLAAQISRKEALDFCAFARFFCSRTAKTLISTETRMKITALIIATLTLLAGLAHPDSVVTKDGSTINGKIVGIDKGKLTIETDFAGTVTIDQEKVATISTDEAIFVTVESGSTYQGIISTGASALTVDSSAGEASVDIAEVTESWLPGATSPSDQRAAAELKKLERKWAYEAAFDLSGKSGNSDSTTFGTSFRGTLKGPDDTLSFFAKANFEESEGVKSADDARGGVSYANKFSSRYNWYVRTEFGYDTIKEIDLLFTGAAGFGYIFADTETTSLVVRGGLGYLFEAYEDDPIAPREDLSSASLDFGLDHSEQYSWGTWVNRATYTPTLDDFGNFRLTYDSSVDLPLKADQWSVRAGVNFNYDSEADVSDLDELDTTYYIRMVLKWL